MRLIDGDTEELLRQLLIAANLETGSWWSDNGVQLIVGVGTIALAGASFWVARNSAKTAKASVEVSERSTAAAVKANQITEDNHKALRDWEELKSRRAHAAKLNRWFVRAMLVAARDADESLEAIEEYAALLDERAALQAPFSIQLHLECELRQLAAESWTQHNPNEINAEGIDWVTGGMRRIQEWAENPSSVEIPFEPRAQLEVIQFWADKHPTTSDDWDD